MTTADEGAPVAAGFEEEGFAKAASRLKMAGASVPLAFTNLSFLGAAVSSDAGEEPEAGGP
jgi:hypothetical protein